MIWLFGGTVLGLLALLLAIISPAPAFAGTYGPQNFNSLAVGTTNAGGSTVMGAIVADELKRAVPELRAHIRAVPASSVTPTTAPTTTAVTAGATP